MSNSADRQTKWIVLNRAFIAAAALVLAACGGGGDEASGDDPEVSTIEASSSTAGSAAGSSDEPAGTNSTTAATQAPTTMEVSGRTPTPPTTAPAATDTTLGSTTTAAPVTTAAPPPTVSIGGPSSVAIDEEFFWPVTASADAVSGTWSSNCGVGNPNWSPGAGWTGSYGAPARSCSLTLTVRNAAGVTASTTKNFNVVEPPAPAPTVSIGGGNTLTIGEEFSWPVSSTNAVSGTWSSNCGVDNPNWTPGSGWSGSYNGPPRTCSLTLTVQSSDGQTASTTKTFDIVAGSA